MADVVCKLREALRALGPSPHPSYGRSPEICPCVRCTIRREIVALKGPPYYLCSGHLSHELGPCGGELHHGAKIANTDYRICDEHLGKVAFPGPEPLSENQLASGFYSDPKYAAGPASCGCDLGDRSCRRAH